MICKKCGSKFSIVTGEGAGFRLCNKCFIESYIELTKSPNVHERVIAMQAIRTLCRRHNITSEALIAVGKLLKDEELYDPNPGSISLPLFPRSVYRVAAYAAQYLRDIALRSPEAIQDLIQNFPNYEGEDREIVMGIICKVGSSVLKKTIASTGLMGTKNLLSALEAILEEKKITPDVCTVISALEKAGSEAVPVLIKVLQSENRELSLEAVKTLKRITHQNFGKNYSLWLEWWQEEQK